jgi:radical SAM protein with 4Fe4S-binding SPASM domain
MEISTYQKALDYLLRSGFKQVRLLGGEPTLHPNFISFVQSALELNLDILLFSNGLISKKNLDFLVSIPDNRLTVLLNTIHPDEKNEKGIKQQKETMMLLGCKIIPGINIFSVKQKLDYLLDYAVRYNLKNEIRIGISHAVLSQNNVYLHPKEYHKIGYNIVLLKMEAHKAGVSLGFDCGFVPCMFPVECFDLLSEELKKAGNCCHPIIDLLSDGNFISCYPLNNFLKIKLHDRLSAKELIDHFEKALTPYKKTGIYRYCSSCPLFNEQCNGGCMAFRIKRFQN